MSSMRRTVIAGLITMAALAAFVKFWKGKTGPTASLDAGGQWPVCPAGASPTEDRCNAQCAHPTASQVVERARRHAETHSQRLTVSARRTTDLRVELGCSCHAIAGSPKKRAEFLAPQSVVAMR
jgi:hypothetical protein